MQYSIVTRQQNLLERPRKHAKNILQFFKKVLLRKKY